MITNYKINQPFTFNFSVEEGEENSQHRNFNFSFLLFNMEGNQTSLIESSDSDIKKCCSESTKKSPKYAVNVFEAKKVTS